MAEKKWTAEQLQAITERGRNILVSAGAGSGKTAVMVERATRLILEDHVPISSMLIVTFTNAAATEMKERLRQALKERLADAVASGDHDEIQWIRKQLDDLHGAQISTFHSFAQRVINEFFPLIDIEPGARVLDAAETEVFKEEALEELFDAEYEEKSDDFIAFLDTYSGEKDDSSARKIILDLYRKLEVIPDGLAVLDEKTAELELGADGFEDTYAYKELVKLCRKDFHAALETAAAAEKLLRDEGLDRLRQLIKGRKAALAGASGVGKSTILNRLHPEAGMETGDVSRKSQRGRHTTRHSELFALDDEGTMIFDTPGFTSFDILDADEEELQFLYPEIGRLAGKCRYDNCRHLAEPECEIKKAVEEGRINISRYRSYKEQMEELIK